MSHLHTTGDTSTTRCESEPDEHGQEPTPKIRKVSTLEENVTQEAPVHRSRKGKPPRRVQNSRQISAHPGFELGTPSTGILSPPMRALSSVVTGVQVSHSNYTAGNLAPYPASVSCMITP